MTDAAPRRRARRAPAPLRAGLLAALLAAALGGPPADAGEALQAIEREFQGGIEKVTAATVTCLGLPEEGEQPGRSSGVIVSRRGLVLSDGDAGLLFKQVDKRIVRRHPDVLEVRVPNLKKGDFSSYRAEVVRRVPELDTTLLRITNGPRDGFPGHLTPGTSADLRVGDFAFAMGNSFNLADEAPPSLTAGVLSTLLPFPPGSPQAEKEGPLEWIYTSAAVNPGVNGGPLVDVEGRLVATISGPVLPTREAAADPQQFLGKAIPMDRLRAAYAALPEAAELFAEAKPARERNRTSAALEATVHAAALRAHPAVVSLEIARSGPISGTGPQGGASPVRYTGPVSGFLWDREGLVVTSLYNLTNLATLDFPPSRWRDPPPEASVEAGLAQVQSVTVHLPDGRSLAARLVGTDPRSGVALLRMERPAAPEGGGNAYALPTLEEAPAEALREGRFAIACGNPFGSAPRPAPLVTLGILSKRHEDDADAAWRGQWQTDAGATDGNCGGAVVDLRGRLLGMLTIWSPARHGRSSGIAFVVPVTALRASVADLLAGRTFQRGFLGVQWKGEDMLAEARLELVLPDSPAAAAGLRPEDVIVRLGAHPVETVLDAASRLAFAWAGETVRVGVRRGGETLEREVVLGARPPPDAK